MIVFAPVKTCAVPPHQRAFSLAQLLVVIALVAILAALLLPAASRLLRSGQSAAAANNLRQVANGFLLFAADYDGLMPQYRPGGSSQSNRGLDSNAFWTGWIAPYMDRPLSELPDPVYRSLGGDPDRSSDFTMNSTYPAPFFSVRRIERPNRALLLSTRGVDGPGNWSRISPAEAERDPSKMGFHHGGQAIVAMVDGSIRRLSPEEVPSFAARRSSDPRHQEYAELWNPHPDDGIWGPTAPAPTPW